MKALERRLNDRFKNEIDEILEFGYCDEESCQMTIKAKDGKTKTIGVSVIDGTCVFTSREDLFYEDLNTIEEEK